MTNEQLVLRIKAGEAVADNMLALWQQCQRFIFTIAKRYSAYEDMEDLTQQGYIGLCNAVDGYDPDSETPFINYAAFWIRQSMQRYIDECSGLVKIPFGLQQKTRKYKKFVSAYMASFGRAPSDQEAAHYLGVSYKRLDEVKKAAVAEQVSSLDVPIGDEGSDTFSDIVESPERQDNDLLEELQAEQLKSVLWPLVDDLPGRSAEVLRDRFQKNLSFREIAGKAGITDVQARRWQAKGLRELRSPSAIRQLRPFIDHNTDYDIVYSEALHGNGAERFNTTWTSSTERVAISELER